MSGGLEMHSWPGPGKSWPYPSDPTLGLRTANMTARFNPRDDSLSSTIMNPSPKNNSGSSFEEHLGVKNESKPSTWGKMT